MFKGACFTGDFGCRDNIDSRVRQQENPWRLCEQAGEFPFHLENLHGFLPPIDEQLLPEFGE